jgi:hypothetical protein
MKTMTRHQPPTESQILKNRYDEALQIKAAWDHRLKRALSEHYDALHHGGDRQASERNLAALDVHVADAAGELRVALTAWMTATTNTERRTA